LPNIIADDESLAIGRQGEQEGLGFEFNNVAAFRSIQNDSGLFQDLLGIQAHSPG
jgi:hypothetical protein